MIMFSVRPIAHLYSVVPLTSQQPFDFRSFSLSLLNCICPARFNP